MVSILHHYQETRRAGPKLNIKMAAKNNLSDATTLKVLIKVSVE